MRLRKTMLALVIGVIAALTATVSVIANAGENEKPASKPNIIYFLVDDMSADLLPYMDNVNKLADGGTKFSNYMVSNSLCCTSRATMFTGLHPHNSGVLTNVEADHGGYKYFKKHEDKTYASKIKASGDYRTGYMGKYINQYPMKDGYHVPKGWDEWHVGNGGGYSEDNYKLSNYTGGKKKPIGNGDGKYLVDLLGDRATQFIDRSRKDDKKSFFLQVAPFSPHSRVKPDPTGEDPLFPPAKRDRPGGEFKNGDCGGTNCKDIDVTKLPGFNEKTADKPDWVRDKKLGKKEINTLREDFRNRVRMVQSVDDMVGKVTKKLTKKELDNTYIMFGSDNGFHLGQHRLFRGKTTAYDHDVRVPMLVKRPQAAGGESLKVDRITQNVDLYSTLIDMANGDKKGPTNTDGRSMLGLINGEKVSDWRNAAFVEHKKVGAGKDADPEDPDADQEDAKKGNSSAPTYSAIRTQNDLMVNYNGVSAMEYYDLGDDPHQLKNKPDHHRVDDLTKPLADLAKCGTKGYPDCWKAAHV